MFKNNWRRGREGGRGAEGTGGRKGAMKALIASRKNVTLQPGSGNCRNRHVYIRPRKHTRAKWRWRHAQNRCEMAINQWGRFGDVHAG